MEHDHPHGDSTGCEICNKNIPFEISEDLMENLREGNAVVFAGAGISTENKLVFPYTFYEDVCVDLGVKPSEGPSFPDLMSIYCNQPNGRPKLLRKIRDRFSYIDSFPELYKTATRFHRELSTLFPVDTIVTTNWDDNFEKECGAIPFVTAEDFTFSSVPGRKVFKIHGSVNSFGSLVATREDYERCYENLSVGLLGSSLKLMLATKTVIYIGFSFTDDDFLRIHQILSAEMRGLRPQSYIVTLDKASDQRFREHGLLPIYTDGTYFVSEIKKKLVENGDMLADDRFDDIYDLLEEVLLLHSGLGQINLKKHPDAVYANSYQDGLIHALERILKLRNTGYYSHRCKPRDTILSYEDLQKEKRKAKRYHDVAYIEGYMNGLLFLLADDDMREAIPLYYVMGHKSTIQDFKEYKKISRDSQRLHKGAYKFAEELVAKKIGSGSLTFHHTPFLL